MGSDTFPAEEVSPQRSFLPAISLSLLTWVLLDLWTEPAELQRSALCLLHAFPFILNQARVSQPQAALLGAGEAINSAGLPLPLETRDSWELNSCTCSHQGLAQAALSTGLPIRVLRRGCSPGARIEETTLGESPCSPSSHNCLVRPGASVSPPTGDQSPEGSVKQAIASHQNSSDQGIRGVLISKVLCDPGQVT